IQEAAKVITESIDKEAKVIFGTIKDDRLKKGEVKVTVIATGFPADVQRRSLYTQPERTREINFGSSSTASTNSAAVEKEAPAVTKKETPAVQATAPMASDF